MECDKDKTIIDLFYILLLSFLAMAVSAHTTGVLLSGGCLLMAAAYCSLEEERRSIAVELLLAGIFAFCADTLLGFTVFLVLPTVRTEQGEKHGGYRYFLMFFGYAGWSFGIRKREIADVLLGSFLLCGMLVLSLLLERLLDREKQQKANAKKRLANATVKEMHIRQLNQEIRKNAYLSEKNARLKEREDISRNIHNSVGHTITAAIVTLDAADLLCEKQPKLAREKLKLANDRMRGSLEAIRRAVRVLDEETESIRAADLKGSIDQIVENFVMDTTIEVSKNDDDLSDDVLLPHEYVEFVTGALQEFLTNGVKHGQATRFLILLSGDSGHIRLDVKDNGKGVLGAETGTEWLQNGFGLKKVMAFVERCGGSMELRTEEGFAAAFTLPLSQAVEKHETAL
ncbi:MAG: hypothetical protein IJ567_11910 [Lachnospiraceae bacterium]|nr:hypothetical protein [Lachnospiraceae bacterium]